MKKILMLLITLAATAQAHDLKTRAAYFVAPTALYYAYNMINRLNTGNCPHMLYTYAQNSPLALVLAFQGLTYYCWSQAFKADPKNPDTQCHVTILHR